MSVSQKPMSAIPIATTRRLLINDPNQLPFDYSSTPGGTLFSTTPGGTRIIYERGFLMQMRNSPRSRSPPKNLPFIPGVTICNAPKTAEPGKENKEPEPEHVMDAASEPKTKTAPSDRSPGAEKTEKRADPVDDEQFSIEM